MIRLLKNIFGNKRKEVTSLRETPNIEVSETEYQSETPQLIEKEIEKPEISELTEDEINNFIDIEVKGRFNYYDSDDFNNRGYFFDNASKFVVENQKADTWTLKNGLNVSYNNAGLLLIQLERFGIIKRNDYDDYSILVDNTGLKKINLFYSDYLSLYENLIQEKIKQIELETEKYDDDYWEKERIKQEYLEKERKRKLRQEAKQELLREGLLNNSNTEQRQISQEVKDLVWNRDNGKCVQCGSNEKLEFDHIIPFSKGGSNTYRNVQLLCEKCNREKSNKIG